MARAGDNYEPTAPKPYEFVSIPQVRGQDREHPAGHDRYDAERLSGHLSANLLVLTWLHVGAGSIRLNRSPKYPLIRSHVRVGGQVAMPASSLKGMVRSVAEAISHSCVRVTRAPRNQLPPGAAECRDKEKLCPACRLFGALGYQGLVRFSDAVLHPEEGVGPKLVRMPALHSPGKHRGPYIQSGRVVGRKFYKHGQTVIDANTPVEVCPPRARLDFRIDFDNLSKAEVGLLLTAMGLSDPPFYLKGGGGKPACYGSVMIQVQQFQTWAGAEELYGSYDIEQEATNMKQYLKAAGDLVEPDQLTRITSVLAYDPNRECPSGNY